MTLSSQPASPVDGKLSVVTAESLATTVRPRWVGNIAVIWGLGGVIALLSMAIARLLSISIAAFGFSLTWIHWSVLIISVLFMAYAEGYRTFQKTWAPRVVNRALELRDNWNVLRIVLAPFYCMSFFDATRKRVLTAWITTVCIVLLIVLMNRMNQPWRGLIDAGVVVGLSWGVAAIIHNTVITFFGQNRQDS